MIVLVVLMHLKVTYSIMGSWFYLEGRALDAFSYIVFAIYGSFVQAFFMGLLFFAAGYFVPASLDKKGPIKFTRDRIIRLGIPTLVFMLILNPLIFLLVASYENTFPSDVPAAYTGYITSFEFLGGSGPLWFALALLIFSIAYVLFRLVSSSRKNEPNKKKPVSITNAKIILLIAIISIFTFLSRLFYPIGTSLLNMQLGNFSQYIILFVIGIIVYRRNLLDRLSYKFGWFWFKLSLVLGVPAWFLLLFFGGGLNDTAPFMGGLFWQAAALAAWESFFCVGFCLGLLVVFRKYYNIQGRLSRFLSKNAFGVYVFHAPILVFIALAFQWVVMPPLLKMILMAFIVLPVCFGFVYLIRKVPLMKKMFS